MLAMMKKLSHTNRLAVAGALTVGIFYTILSIYAYFAPDHLMRLIESWHYMPIVSSIKLHVTLGAFIKGLLGHMVFVYLIVAVWDKLFHAMEK